MNSLSQLWRTTTVRLTALFILIFAVLSVVLLGYVGFQSSIEIQRAQARDVNWEIRKFENLYERRGMRALAIAVQLLARQPGPGIYYFGKPDGEMIAGNFHALPLDVLANAGQYSFTYSHELAFDRRNSPPPRNREEARQDIEREGKQAYAVVRTLILDGGFRLVVGRDIVQRRNFTQIIVRTMTLGVIGIIILSAIAGGLTARRVLKRINAINKTSSEIRSGNMSQRVPVTKRNDEFDQLAIGLNEMLDRIEQLMQGLKEVTDNVAHDLKTPLTRLRNRAEAALREGGTEEEHKAALELTIMESDRLISTFNGLLLIARLEAGSKSKALSQLNLSEVVADVGELYAPVIEDAGGILEIDVQNDITLNANRELLAQALVNLLENAIKYALNSEHKLARDGDEKITLSLRHQAQQVEIIVADNGPGIPVEDRVRVLERFVRLEKSRTEIGSGLGLALVSAVVQLHKGSITIEDNNPGVRAIIRLPAS